MNANKWVTHTYYVLPVIWLYRKYRESMGLLIESNESTRKIVYVTFR
jgi:hypothetical protein